MHHRGDREVPRAGSWSSSLSSTISFKKTHEKYLRCTWKVWGCGGPIIPCLERRSHGRLSWERSLKETGYDLIGGTRAHHPSRKAAEVLRSRDLFGAERRPELRMAAPWAGQSSGIARSRARAARRPCGEVVGHRPQAANYLDSREQEKVMSRFVFSIVPLNCGKEAICTRECDFISHAIITVFMNTTHHQRDFAH